MVEEEWQHLEQNPASRWGIGVKQVTFSRIPQVRQGSVEVKKIRIPKTSVSGMKKQKTGRFRYGRLRITSGHSGNPLGRHFHGHKEKAINCHNRGYQKKKKAPPNLQVIGRVAGWGELGDHFET